MLFCSCSLIGTNIFCFIGKSFTVAFVAMIDEVDDVLGVNIVVQTLGIYFVAVVLDVVLL